MKKLLAFVLVVVMVLSMVACGSKNNTANTGEIEPGMSETGKTENNDKTEDKDDTGKADEVSYKTDVVIGVGANLTSFDPYDQTNFPHTRMQQLVYDRLVYYNPTTKEISPMLAESWEISDDSTEYTFKLRQDVTFHNGEKFTADDVVYSIERGKQSQTATVAGYFQFVDKCEVLDDYTIKLILTGPNSDLLYNFANSFMGMINREACEADPEKGYEIGTGLWIWDEKVDNDHFSFTRNDNYWGGTTPTEHLEMRVIPEDSARLIALENGEIDLCETVAVTEVEYASANDEVELIEIDTVSLSYASFNMQKEGPWQDKNFRLAVAHAIDWDAFIVGFKDGHAVRATTVWSHAQFGYAPQEGYDYDVELAKDYLAKSSYAGETVSIMAIPLYKTAAVIVVDMLGKIGIKAELNEVASANRAAATKEGQYDMTIYQMSFGSAGSEASRLFITSTGGARAMEGTAIYDRVATLLSESLAIKDTEKRLENYAEVQRLVFEEATIIPMIYPKAFAAQRVGVEGVDYAANTNFDYRFIKAAE